MIRLLVPAIHECLQRGGVAEPASVPFLINVAEPDEPGRPKLHDGEFASMLAEHFGGRLHPQSLLLRQGRVGAAEALSLARGLFARGSHRCLIAGVDTLISAATLGALAKKRRLKTAINPDGLIPGEAAGALLLESSRSSDAAIRISGVGFGEEAVPPDSDDPVLGLGLAAALRGALAEASIDIADAACRISDMTGEKYFFQEANYAMGRLLRRRKPDFPIWHPMDSIGDSGAAAGFCLLAIAMAAFTKGYALGDTLLCQMSAEGGRRAAVIVQAGG